MTHIQSLSLTAFRNYDSTTINGLGIGFVALIGENGAGKTNCLEALSLLSPGRGLRNATVADCQSQASQTPWAISTRLIDNDGDGSQLGVGRDPQRMDKKMIR
jgi:DNA replication and repair protein RecF